MTTFTTTITTTTFHHSGESNQVPTCLQGLFTCIRWQVTLCDPIQ